MAAEGWLQSGCQACVWDVYFRDLRAYEVAASRVRSTPVSVAITPAMCMVCELLSVGPDP